jgi:hypothetical protein
VGNENGITRLSISTVTVTVRENKTMMYLSSQVELDWSLNSKGKEEDDA